MLDFASALYLGLRHAHASLRPWAELTDGRPAALQPRAASQALELELARLIGTDQACLAPSTLHLFWDLFAVLAQHSRGGAAGLALLVETGSYPIARWGVERLQCQGAAVHAFPAHDCSALKSLADQASARGLRPVVLSDGVDAASGRVSPLGSYLQRVEPLAGWVVVDDTQGLGILGRGSSPRHPYGSGGGGSAAWLGLQSPSLVIGASLAKGLGVPVAVLAGPVGLIERFREQAPTRTHCSPPSAAVIAACAHALKLNRTVGDAHRIRLVSNVRRFRRGLDRLGVPAAGSLFPVQTPRLAVPAAQVHHALRQRGVHSVLHRPRAGQTAWLSFLIRADHMPHHIDHALQCLAHVLSADRNPQRPRRERHESHARL